jgi:hypothetical protein
MNLIANLFGVALALAIGGTVVVYYGAPVFVFILLAQGL